MLTLPALALETPEGPQAAINDVAIHRRAGERVAELAYAIDGEEAGSVRCDGLVLSTPAGSTGYNLANGGPVLAWGVEGFVVSFIAPHSLTARALVVAPSDLLSVHNRSQGEVDISLDGRPAGRARPRRRHHRVVPARGGGPGAGPGLVVLPAAAPEVREAGLMSTIVIAGGHGQIALRLARAAAARAATPVRALIRNPGHAADVRATGARAGRSPTSRRSTTSPSSSTAPTRSSSPPAPGRAAGPSASGTVDLGAAVKLLEAARRTGVRRYLMISSMGAGDPAAGAEAMRPYLEAKAQADAALAASDLDWTIVRPGGLTDEPGTGRVEVAPLAGPPRHDHARRRRRGARSPASTSRARCARPSSCCRARRRSRRRSRRSSGLPRGGASHAPIAGECVSATAAERRRRRGSATRVARDCVNKCAGSGRRRPVRRWPLVQARTCSWSCASRTSSSSNGPSCASPRA